MRNKNVYMSHCKKIDENTIKNYLLNYYDNDEVYFRTKQKFIYSYAMPNFLVHLLNKQISVD